MIEANGLTATGSKAQLHVFDILTGFNGTVNGQAPVNGELTYIDKTIGFVGSAWPFVNASGTAETPAYYRWTKTGTHTFFGYLTKDPEGNSKWEWDETVNNETVHKTVTPGWTASSKTVSITNLKMTPATTQFDFLFSDVHSRDAATKNYNAVPLSLKHLFTALSVELINETIVPIEDVQVSFTGVYPTQTATISWSGIQSGYPTPTYTPGDAAELILGTADLPKFVEGQTPTPLFTDNSGAEEYRLLWPQNSLDAASVKVTYLASSGTDFVTKSLADLKDASNNDIDAFEAGKKYILKITVTAEDLEFEILVDPLDEHYYGKDESHSDYLIKP